VLRGRLSERCESAFEEMAPEPGTNQTVLVGAGLATYEKPRSSSRLRVDDI
jgi:hypothetical protein